VRNELRSFEELSSNETNIIPFLTLSPYYLLALILPFDEVSGTAALWTLPPRC